MRELEQSGHPVITIRFRDAYDIGAEFLRWEIAVAVAGAVLGINPFDEPNVAEAKERTAEVLQETFRGERVPDPGPGALEEDISVYISEPVRRLLEQTSEPLLPSLLGRSLAREGDYFAIMAFIP